MAIEDVLDRLTKLKRFKCGSPATGVEIAELERRLGIQLPVDYVKLLRKFGFVRWFGQAIFGIHQIEAEKAAGFDLDAVSQTPRARNEHTSLCFRELPAKLIAIKKYDAGGWYFMFGAESSRHGQVALFEHESSGKEAQPWASLEDFLIWLNV
jgi:hypothetical protein